MTEGERNQVPAIRIVIAEDQAHVRRGAAHLLSLEQDMEVVGQACNGAEAVELARALRPDVILMDLHMPVKGGVAATREIIQMLPATQILVLTTLHDDEPVFEAVRAGAHAYLLKDTAEDELLETIRALVKAAGFTRTALILVGRVLGEAGFSDSRLYAADHHHVLRPREAGGGL